MDYMYMGQGRMALPICLLVQIFQINVLHICEMAE